MNSRLGTVFLALLVAATATPTQAQDRRISGRVTDAQRGTGLLEATVILAGIQRSTRTDADGDFLLFAVPAGEVRLLVRSIGYPTLPIPTDETLPRQP